MKLAGKTALVTGGAVRIGRAICEALAARGCRMVIHYRDSGRQARELAANLRKAGTEAFCVRCDLSSSAQCRRLVPRAAALAGRLDILVNNAAVFGGDSARVSARSLARLQVNLVAPMILTGEFAAQARSGRVINILDRRIASVEKGAASYQLSKKALADFTEIAAVELAPGITVNAVAPGAALPPAGRNLAPALRRAGPAPLGRHPAPADIAGAVVFLAESDVITGQVLFVDGGRHLV